MKKLLLLSILLISTYKLTAQNCVVGNVALFTQAQVDAFVIAHTAPNPICDTIDGNLFIGKSFGTPTDIDNISGLSFLTTINGNLKIERTILDDLTGLDNVNFIGDYLVLRSNSLIADIDAFSSLITLNNYLNISFNDGLEDLSGFSSLTNFNSNITILGNDTLQDSNGFEGITTIDNLTINNNASLPEVDGFINVTTINGSLIILDNDILQNVDGFLNITSINTGLTIISNPELVNVNGFSNLAAFNSPFSSIIISSNAELLNLDGFSNFSNNISQDLIITSNPKLVNIDGLKNINSISNNLTIEYNTLLNECCSINRFILGTKYIGGTIAIIGNNTNCASKFVIVNYCTDDDSDNIQNNEDNCININNPNQEDTDGDTIGDVCDNCPNVANAPQLDSNNNGIGDACEALGTGTDSGGVGIGTADPKSQLEVTQGDVFIKNEHRGIIMKSPLGKCFRIQPNEEGNLKTKEITCPDN